MKILKSGIYRMGWIIGVIVVAFSTTYGQGTLSLPQTGQTKCYNSKGEVVDCKGTGQDGETRAGVAWPEPRFTNPDGSVPIKDSAIVDQLTALMWTRDGGSPAASSCKGGPMEWPKAIDYVNCLNNQNYLGYSDWRLPNMNELESLINAEALIPSDWLNSQGFTRVQHEPYWTSTASGDTSVDVWTVYFRNGIMSTAYKWHYLFYAWPTRTWKSSGEPASLWKTGQTHTTAKGDDGDLKLGVPWPDPRFTDHGNGTVTDRLTGLMWTKEANLSGTGSCRPSDTWQGAFDSVACLNKLKYLGYDDWRLPNKNELFSLIDRSRYSPALPSGHPFSIEPPSKYWSSGTFANIPEYAWAIEMGGGNGGAAVKASSANTYIWPVRAGKVAKLKP